jgi:hypothetical protein
MQSYSGHGPDSCWPTCSNIRDLCAVVVKGFADSVRAYQVLRPSAVESRFEAVRGARLTPLAGRGEELDLLLRRWEQAKGGSGSVVLVSGEPGIGKSRLAQTLLERLSDEPLTRLRSSCSPTTRTQRFTRPSRRSSAPRGFGATTRRNKGLTSWRRGSRRRPTIALPPPRASAAL